MDLLGFLGTPIRNIIFFPTQGVNILQYADLKWGERNVLTHKNPLIVCPWLSVCKTFDLGNDFVPTIDIRKICLPTTDARILGHDDDHVCYTHTLFMYVCIYVSMGPSAVRPGPISVPPGRCHAIVIQTDCRELLARRIGVPKLDIAVPGLVFFLLSGPLAAGGPRGR